MTKEELKDKVSQLGAEMQRRRIAEVEKAFVPGGLPLTALTQASLEDAFFNGYQALSVMEEEELEKLHKDAAQESLLENHTGSDLESP